MNHLIYNRDTNTLYPTQSTSLQPAEGLVVCLKCGSTYIDDYGLKFNPPRHWHIRGRWQRRRSASPAG
jgi:hypothetical protein